MINTIKSRIEAALPGAQVWVEDTVGDNTHFEATVVSDRFEGISLIEQHRMVMAALEAELKGPLHALGLKTYTPERWNAIQAEK